MVITHQGVIGGRTYWAIDPQVQYLASLGYAVLQVNFRGSDGFGQAFRIAANRHWDTLVPDDILSGVKYLASKGAVDASKVCILGYSFGAHTAFATVMRSPTAFRCVIGNTGIYDLPLLMKNKVLDLSEAALIKNLLLQLLPENEMDQKAQSPA